MFCGRDAVLPKLVKLLEDGSVSQFGIDLVGQAVFHTAVSRAGVGPTSSNKLDIESSIGPLSAAGVRLHLGKGQLSSDTIEQLDRHRSIYAVIPPVTALLGSKIRDIKIVGFPELGMEALRLIQIENFPAIVAAAHGESVYD